MDHNIQDHFFSIIVPVYNNENTIMSTLFGILDSDYANFELIIVNDGSSDHSIEMASRFSCRILNLETNHGAAYARNAGAKAAKGDVLLFIDSDVIVDYDTLSHFRKAFQGNSADAVVGIYGKKQNFLNPASVYKNLFLNFSQNNNSLRFWSGCAGVKKDVFLRLGGFDEKSKGALSSEDTAFGYALRKNGYTIQIRRDIQVTHNHKYTLKSLLKNDFVKTSEWAKFLLKNRLKIKTSGYYLNISNYLSLLCVFLFTLSIPFAIAKGHPFSTLMFFCFLIFMFLNIGFYYLLVKVGGWKYLIFGPLLHALSYSVSILGIFYAIVSLFKTYRKIVF